MGCALMGCNVLSELSDRDAVDLDRRLPGPTVRDGTVDIFGGDHISILNDHGSPLEACTIDVHAVDRPRSAACTAHARDRVACDFDPVAGLLGHRGLASRTRTGRGARGLGAAGMRHPKQQSRTEYPPPEWPTGIDSSKLGSVWMQVHWSGRPKAYEVQEHRVERFPGWSLRCQWAAAWARVANRAPGCPPWAGAAPGSSLAPTWAPVRPRA